MAELKGTQTLDNLKAAYAAEAQSSSRYRYLATIADFEGSPEAAVALTESAESDSLNAHGHLDFLKQHLEADAALLVGSTAQNLAAAMSTSQHLAETVYPQMAAQARAEGLDDIADWFETLVKSKRHAARRFAALLHRLD